MTCSFIQSLIKKIEQHQSTYPQKPTTIYPLQASEWSYFFHHYLAQKKEGDHFVITPQQEMAEKLFEKFRHHSDLECYLLPDNEISPYTEILSQESDLLYLFALLATLTLKKAKKQRVLFLSVKTLVAKLPRPQFFKDHHHFLAPCDIISPEELAKKLTLWGYKHQSVADAPGSFVKKGEIFDIFPVGESNHQAFRLHYFDEMIEEIYPIDLLTQRTDRSHPITSLLISAAPAFLSHSLFTRTLRNHLPIPPVSEKERFEKRKDIFNTLTNGTLFPDYPKYLPLFFEEWANIFDFHTTGEVHLVEIENVEQSITYIKDALIYDFEQQTSFEKSDCLLPHPDKLFWGQEDLLPLLEKHTCLYWQHIIPPFIESGIKLHIEKSKNYFLRHLYFEETRPKFDQIVDLIRFLGEHHHTWKEIVFCYTHEEVRKELCYLIDLHLEKKDLLQKIHFQLFPLEEGLIVHSSHSLILSENDFFTQKIRTHKKRKKEWDPFAEALASLKPQDYVIHSEYGIGRYLGMEVLEIGGQKADFLILLYEDNDKVYVPIYKLNQIQKYADSGQIISLANLKTKKFEAAKQRAKKAVKTLAFDLIELEAKRAMYKAHNFPPPDHYYDEFELSFPFESTTDQKKAVEEILEDMQKTRPMDRLVCGDVGFGKTEVAMRAAFLALLDKKQVAILVPTTILALQHENSFVERFKNFGVRIASLSRLKTPKQIKEILADLAQGRIDIVIGTHRLLGADIKFYDLGLLIIDEEQRFGVGHKEKLKLFKANVHCLTLTATPIPRTLQMAFLGIKSLSLIQTPPPKRQAIQTHIIQQDDYTIKTAIEKELKRGGQVFYVHNRIEDMDILVANLKAIVPDAKITWAHGQLEAKELESRMQAFYHKRYNVLVATTIIESGLDVPCANTMIVHDAHCYGLSQLHQLRGRIGRSDKKAFAYLMVPKLKILSTIASKRLEALQTYAKLGSGLSIASCDLELRGTGDLLGAEQSGHLDSIGAELYMELIREAIAEIKGTQTALPSHIELQVPFSYSIPHRYIADGAERLRHYKRLSNSYSIEQIDAILVELLDIYGPPPEQLEHLGLLLKVRILLGPLCVSSLSVGQNDMTLRFDTERLKRFPDISQKMITFFMKHPKKYKLRQEGSVTYHHDKKIDPVELWHIVGTLLHQFTL